MVRVGRGSRAGRGRIVAVLVTAVLIAAVVVGGIWYVADRGAEGASSPTSVATSGAADVGNEVISGADAAFIRSLDDKGIDYGTVGDAIWSAGVVCDSVHSDPAAELRTITDVFTTTAGLTRTQAQDFVGAAVSAYCPQYTDYVTR